jgi:hypothetical protein
LIEEGETVKKSLLAALVAAGLGLLAAPPASAQSVSYDPVTGQPYVQYYTPYTYGSTSYYYYPNTGYVNSYGLPYMTYGGPPMVYGPGYTMNTPAAYASYWYGTRYGSSYPYYTTRTWRWWR